MRLKFLIIFLSWGSASSKNQDILSFFIFVLENRLLPLANSVPFLFLKKQK